ncbi:hypothetical protein [Kordia sp.]|uniref:hypothetical protein n=1 Tax=Kordia sp. TaxID=1965332 RepID=UPI0025C11B62|nr:hypothetical protein [Kordia sp.]
MVDTDYVRLYTYDEKNRLIAEKVYAYEYNFDENNTKAISDRDFSEYQLFKTITYQYDHQNNVVKKVQEGFGGRSEGRIDTTIRMYNTKNRLAQYVFTDKRRWLSYRIQIRFKQW